MRVTKCAFCTSPKVHPVHDVRARIDKPLLWVGGSGRFHYCPSVGFLDGLFIDGGDIRAERDVLSCAVRSRL